MQTHAVSVRDYLRMIFRRKWALVLPVVAAAVAFFPLWAATPDTYKATATVRRDDLAAAKTSPAALISNEAPRIDIQAIRAEILAWQNLDAVMAETKLDVNLKSDSDRQAEYAELRKAIDVRAGAPSRGTSFIDISVVLKNAAMAQAVANSVANHYVERTKNAQRNTGLTAIEFLKSERDRYHDLLQACENELEDYRAKHYADLPQVKESIRSRLLQLRIDQDTRELQLKDAQSRLVEATKQLAQVPQTVRTDVTTGQNPARLDLENNLSQMQRNLQLLLTTYTDSHPDVIHLRNQIAAIKEQLKKEPARVDTSEKEIINPQYQALQGDVSSLKQEVSGDQAALRQLAAAEGANEDELAGLVKQEKHYNDLLRNQQQYSQLYNQYWSQYEDAKRRATVQEQQYTVKVELYSPALRPAKPYRQPVIKLALGCLMGGVGAGLALMFGLEFCDRSFRNIEDASSFLKVPVLASLTRIVPAEQALAWHRRRWVVGSLVLVLLLFGLTMGAIWYVGGHHTPGDVIDGVRGVLMSIKARLAS